MEGSAAGEYQSSTKKGLVLVTGGGRGIGAAIALGAAQLGCSVLVNFSNNRPAADELVRRIEGNGGRALAIQADVSDEAAVLDLFTAADKMGVPLTSLINNAGITGGFARVDQARVDETIEPRLLRSAMLKSVLNPIAHCIAVLLAFVDTRLSIALYALLPLAFFVPSKLEKQATSREKAAIR